MWSFSCRCKSKARLAGKTVVITGANSGIGKETARDLYRRGARVILACRNLDKANAAVEDIKTVLPSNPEREQFNGDPGELIVCQLDLASFASVRKCAKHLTETEENIHILINNAGVVMCPFEKTEDGYESQLQVNHLGHFLLTLLLLPKIKNSGIGKIINVTSIVQCLGNIYFDDINSEKSYGPIKAYIQSKLANILFTRELARRLKEAKIEGISTYSLHPGLVDTEGGRHLDTLFFRGAHYISRTRIIKLFLKTPELGAQTTLHCALDDEAAKQTGLYYKKCRAMTPWGKARNEQLAQRLWNLSVKFVGFEPQDNFSEMLIAPSRTIVSAF